MIDMIVNVAGAVLIVGVIWWFWIAKSKAAKLKKSCSHTLAHDQA